MKSVTQSLNQSTNWIMGLILVGGCLLYLSQNLSSGRKITPTSDLEFKEVVEKETRPVLVKFGATWCGPCRSTDTALAKYEDTADGEVKVVILDVDSSPALSRQYRVSSIPHLFLFHNGKVLDERVGGMDTQDIRDWLKSKESLWKN